MAFENEVSKMRKEIEELKSESLEQLHYEKMLAYKWKLIAIVFILIAILTNALWLYAWNVTEYQEYITEEIISDEINTTTTITQEGENLCMKGVDIYGTTINNNHY